MSLPCQGCPAAFCSSSSSDSDVSTCIHTFTPDQLNPRGSGVPVVRVLLQRHLTVIELDDGKILTGKPDQFDGKNHGFRLRFSPTNQSSDTAEEPCDMLVLPELWAAGRLGDLTIRRARSSPDSIGVPSLRKIDSIITKVSVFHPVTLPVALPHGELSLRHLLLWLSSKKFENLTWLISLKSEKCADFLPFWLSQVLMVFTMATFFGPWVPSVPWPEAYWCTMMIHDVAVLRDATCMFHGRWIMATHKKDHYTVIGFPLWVIRCMDPLDVW